MTMVAADERGWIGAPARAGGVMARLFAIDVRSLAAFRIALALILITDMWGRGQWLRAHYSDEGVLPRTALIAHHLPSWAWSLHLLSGQWQFQALLFALALAAAIGLLIGWRTRLMAAISWVLLVSLQDRNPLLLQGGDVLLRCLLFWALFLPLGAVASVDRWRSRAAPPPRAIASDATMALLLQVCVVYVCTGLEKTSPVWTSDRTAIQYALELGPFQTAVGAALLHAPGALKVLTAACLLLERYGPLLVLLPLCGGWFRLGVVMLFMCFHLGLAVAMRLGPFPYICLAAWMAFLPSVAWDALLARARWGAGLTLLNATPGPGMHALRALLVLPGLSQGSDGCTGALRVRDANGQVHHGASALLCLMHGSPWARWLVGIARQLTRHPHPRLDAVIDSLGVPAPVNPTRDGDRHQAWELAWPLRAVCAALLVLMLLWNLRIQSPQLGSALLSHACDPIVQAVRLDQRWNMFAPMPARTDGWCSAPARTRGGATVDLLSGGKPLEGAACGTAPCYADERWRKYFSNLESPANREVRTYLAQYLLRSWNAAHAGAPLDQVTEVTIRLWSRQTRLDVAEPYRPHDLWFYASGRRGAMAMLASSKVPQPTHGAGNAVAASIPLASVPLTSAGTAVTLPAARPHGSL